MTIILWLFILVLIRGFPLWSGLLYGLKIQLNLMFNMEKTWGQSGKNISPTKFKIPTK